MNEKLQKWRKSTSAFWTSRSKGQKGSIIGGVALVFILIASLIFFSSNINHVPLYNNLSLQEAGQITGELDTRSVPYELANGGSTILVPEEQVDSLLLDFASMGLPSSGSIDYSFFSENASWGITENEFSVMKLDAMQTELGNLISGIEGIQDANVMINMPEQPVFANEATAGEASVAIMIHTQPGYQFEGNQIEGLYHLVSKAIPNLNAEDIIIMNQYFEYYDRDTQFAGGQDTYLNQQTIKRDVERDIQRRLQQMLGTMVGNENIVVSVTADIDFSQENRTEELVEPVDLEAMEGIPVSLETIQESYVGEGAPDDVVGTGEEDIANFPAGTGENGEYELDRETINYEFNRIRREIVESPYQIRDLGIQVAVNSTRQSADGEIEFLNQQEQTDVQDGIESILNSIIETSVDSEIQDEEAEANTSIVFQEFSTSAVEQGEPSSSGIPLWLYIVGGILLIVVVVLIFMMRRRNRTEQEWIEEVQEEEVDSISNKEEPIIPDLPTEDSEEVIRRKQLEKIANEKPEEFAKLLRSWMNED